MFYWLAASGSNLILYMVICFVAVIKTVRIYLINNSFLHPIRCLIARVENGQLEESCIFILRFTGMPFLCVFSVFHCCILIPGNEFIAVNSFVRRCKGGFPELNGTFVFCV